MTRMMSRTTKTAMRMVVVFLSCFFVSFVSVGSSVSISVDGSGVVVFSVLSIVGWKMGWVVRLYSLRSGYFSNMVFMPEVSREG